MLDFVEGILMKILQEFDRAFDLASFSVFVTSG
jgi:hypothetical protein